MYNKLFSKIVDSSIWLEPTPTRIVWLMFIAVMNEDGFVQFASVANVAHRARITDEEAEQAIQILEGPDPNSADDENDGRRIEKVPGGWIVLNAQKYRDLVTREMVREQTRIRVARKREKDKGVTECNADVTPRNAKVTPSDTDTDTDTDTKKKPPNPLKGECGGFDLFWSEYPNKQAKLAAKRAWLKIKPDEREEVMSGIARWKRSESWLKDDGQFIPHPATFLNQRRFEDSPKPKALKKKIYYNHLPPKNDMHDSDFVAVRDVARREMARFKEKFK